MRHLHIRLDSRGQILFFSLIFMGILLSLSAGLIGYTMVNRTAQHQTVAKAQALALAEAGSDKALYQLNQNANYSGETNTALGSGTFTTTVTSINQSAKRITSTGNVPYGRGLIASRTIQATASIDLTTISFSYGVQVGQGGFTMANGSKVNGNVYSNGTISGSGIVTGAAYVAGGVAPNADQTWTGYNSDFYLGSDDDLANAAQSFIPSATNTISRVLIYLKKVGDPSDLDIKIVSDNNGVPSRTVKASGSISASKVTGSYGWIEGSLSSNPTLNANTKYWLILIDSKPSASKYYYWGLDTGDGYASNTGKYSDDWNDPTPNWTSANGDFNFQIYMGAAVTGLSGVTVNGTAKALSMTGCTILGNAYFQTTNDCTVSGTQYPNTAPPSPQPFPISDAQITEWESAALTGGTTSSYTLATGATTTIGPIVINGNLTLDNHSKLKLAGPVWVKGDIILDNGSKVIVDSSIGDSGTVLIADKPSFTTTTGKLSLSNGSVGEGNGQSGSWMLFISTYAGNEYAIDVLNNASSSIFYAPYGTIHINNNAHLLALTGYLIALDNNAIIDYENGLQDATFSDGPGGSWVYQAGSYVITN
jgi:uncharacterized protein (UPF0333 family)